MRSLTLLVFGVHLAYAARHSLEYFYTGVSGVDKFPEFIAVGMVDGEQHMYFDSNTKEALPKTEWIRLSERDDYWHRETQVDIGYAQLFKNNIQVVTERFNQSIGVHTFQRMYGCEWNDETEETDGFNAFGYDGEDFFSLDIKEMRFISPVQQALPTIQKWNNDKGLIENDRQYFSDECIKSLKKYVQVAMKKTVSPQVSLLQKDSSSSVLCHVTGFYPSGVKISWLKNGQDHYKDVDIGELVPNEDETFQKTSTLNTGPEEWKQNQYTCVVEHQGKTINTILTEKDIKTNNGGVLVGIIVVVVAALAMLVVIGVIGYMVYQKKGKSGFVPVNRNIR